MSRSLLIGGEDLQLDFSDIEPFVRNYGATKGQWEAALRSTQNRLAKEMAVYARRGIAPDVRVTQKNLRPRIWPRGTRMRSNGTSSSVWFGFNDIPVDYLNPRKTGKGYTTRATGEIKGAFAMTTKTGKKSIMVRQGKKRLPVKRAEADIHDKAYRSLETRVWDSPYLRARFIKIFEEQLNFRVHIYGR